MLHKIIPITEQAKAALPGTCAAPFPSQAVAGATSEFGIVTDTVRLGEMEYDGVEDCYFFPCRCSGRFILYVAPCTDRFERF